MKGMIVATIVCVLVVTGYYFGKKYYLKPGIVQGSKAVDIILQEENMKLALSDLQGSYVLLDFWGSWCSPCIKTHPELVKLYKDFHDKAFTNGSNFEIVSIALEKNMDSWQRIIQADRLVWPHHFLEEEMFDSPTAIAYNVRQLPTKFLISPEGMIIAVDPSLGAIRKTLASHIEKPDNQ